MPTELRSSSQRCSFLEVKQTTRLVRVCINRKARFEVWSKSVIPGGRGLSRHLRPDLRAERIDRHGLAVASRMPKDPAIAGGRALDERADLVDRAARFGGDERAVRADLGGEAACRIGQDLAGLYQPALDQAAEGHARLLALRLHGQHVLGRGLDGGDALAGERGVFRLAFDADEAAAEADR